MSDDREAIRSRVDIVELVGQRVLLKKSGKNWKGLCPFHQDKNPSFYVSPTTGYYKCWSCGESGDIFNWVMKTQNVEFGEAMKILAQHAGITLSKQRPESASERAKSKDIMAFALKFFQERLKTATEAQNYLARRGIQEDVVHQWELGFAPSSDHELATALVRGGIKLADAKELFLVEDDGTGGYFDKFRGRLMFPIRDERGQLVAFGGRIIGDGQPKYINSSDTPIFRKSKVLYGMNAAKDSISSSQQAVLVEGYLDVIACHRAGVTNAVASLGTSLAEDHAKLLKRWCNEVVILYDADAAGEKAAARAVEILKDVQLNVRVALLPEGEDPDTLLREAGAAAVIAAANQGMTPLEFKLLRLENALNPESEDFWRQVIEALSEATSWPQIEKQVSRLASKYLPGGREGKVEGIMDQVRHAQRQRLKAKRSQSQPAFAVVNAPTSLPAAEKTILKGFLESETRTISFDALKDSLLVSAKGKRIAEAILESFADLRPTGLPSEWLHLIIDEEARVALAEVDIESGSALHEVIAPPRRVTHQEVEDAASLLRNERDHRLVAELRTTANDEEAVQAAFDRMKEIFSRGASRWSRE